jgi:UDP-N-acetylglucosamine--N-acetylmuramyl-(pentapeptide) pyrophosphoryl-undecaprenol N-acetylglucosamine transferase
VVDLMVTGTPAVLIPLPWSARGEQQKNAKYYESLGAAKVLDQERISSKDLLLGIEDLFSNLKSYKQAAIKSKENLIDNAAQKIVDELYSLLD